MPISAVPPVVLFAFVGCVGFVVDAAVFSLFFELIGLPVFTARMIAFVCAATTTWAGNRVLTFKHRARVSRLTQWKKFMLAACFSALPNLLVFKISLHLLEGVQYAPYVALVLGVLAGMVSNYTLSSRWVFVAKKNSSDEIQMATTCGKRTE